MSDVVNDDRRLDAVKEKSGTISSSIDVSLHTKCITML